MGSFYTNITLVGPGQKEVSAFMAKKGRTCYVSPTLNGRTIVYDLKSEEQDSTVLEKLASLLSREFLCPAFAVLNHDDDILSYRLYSNGKKVDIYDSCPNYFTLDGGENFSDPEGGDAYMLCKAFGVPEKSERVEKILRQGKSGDKGFVFESERNQALARELGVHEGLAVLGYEYVEHEGSEEDEIFKGIVHIAGKASRGFFKIIGSKIASFMASTENDEPPIHEAIIDGNWENVREILARDPKQIQSRDIADNSVLKQAVKSGEDEANIKFLIACGADINEGTGLLGDTALHLASYALDVNMAKILIDNGADTNRKNIDGKTPLHCMGTMSDFRNSIIVDNGGRYAALCAALLLGGADPTMKDNEGKTPLDYARNTAMITLVEMMS